MGNINTPLISEQYIVLKFPYGYHGKRKTLPNSEVKKLTRHLVDSANILYHTKYTSDFEVARYAKLKMPHLHNWGKKTACVWDVHTLRTRLVVDKDFLGKDFMTTQNYEKWIDSAFKHPWDNNPIKTFQLQKPEICIQVGNKHC